MVALMRKPALKQKSLKPTILVVEDDENIAYYLKLMLRREGFNVIHAADGREAVAVMGRFRPPRLILMDIKLPFVDGIQLVGMVRGHATWMHVPIILLSSVSEEMAINRALSTGANDYFVKPFLTLEVIARVRHYVPETNAPE
jgi:DNA-binding response OmpR family regulator